MGWMPRPDGFGKPVGSRNAVPRRASIDDLYSLHILGSGLARRGQLKHVLALSLSRESQPQGFYRRANLAPVLSVPSRAHYDPANPQLLQQRYAGIVGETTESRPNTTRLGGIEARTKGADVGLPVYERKVDQVGLR